MADSQPPDDDLTEGRRRRDQAADLLQRHRRRLIRNGQRALIGRLLDHGTATTDDLDLVNPPGIRPTWIGIVPLGLVTADVIQSIGYEASRRPERHAGVVRRWSLTAPDRARRWLTSHPAIAEPDDDCGAVVLAS